MHAINPYLANRGRAEQVRARRRGHMHADADVGMISIAQAPGAGGGPAAASPVRGGFGAQANLHPVHYAAPTKVRGAPLGFDSGAAGVAAAMMLRGQKRCAVCVLDSKFPITT